MEINFKKPTIKGKSDNRGESRSDKIENGFDNEAKPLQTVLGATTNFPGFPKSLVSSENERKIKV